MRLAITLVFTASLAQSMADDTADLEKARELFPQFSKSVYTDEDKARKAYDSLVALSPRVQQRLLAWLDEEYEEKKSAYQREKNGSSSRPTNSRSDAAEIKTLRKELETVRVMGDEDEMKKVLKETGWPAMLKLLRLNKSTIGSYSRKKISEPNPKNVQAALETAQKIGQLRYELRKKIGREVTDVDEDLNGAEETEQATSMEMSRKAASVLKKNEKMKDEIPRNEYDGILELNHWRIAAGMGPLLIDPKLCEASRDHSKNMAEHSFFAHESPIKGKKTPWDRAKRFNTSARGENIAINGSTEASNKAWFYSPGHHKNMFNPEFSVMGLGVHGRHYTQLFR